MVIVKNADLNQVIFPQKISTHDKWYSFIHLVVCLTTSLKPLSDVSIPSFP
jgi:hypothetical protein